EGDEEWVFYEGPPTANGKPHFGHLMARVYKDLFPRYKTMRGYHVKRKGGWDTHGLPVELEVEKELGLDNKEEIEDYGIEKFVEKCKESVWQYKGEWERMMERMGFWIDLDDPYITYEDDYIETLWWELKNIWEQGLLYKGHKVLPYCPRCGTGLSSHEVAQGYEMTEDPSIFVKFPIEGEPDASLLAWTTTPWTIPSNTALAISSELWYARVSVEGEELIMAKALLDKVLGPDYELIEEFSGEELVGKSYEPPYRLSQDPGAYEVHDADFVTLDEGTGIVHVAPSFGEEDAELGEREGIPFVQPLDLDGKFTSMFPFAEGEFVKDADDDIVEDLEERDILLRHEPYEHEYPFCWRCDTPLLYFALDSWYVKTTEKKDEIIGNNQKISWHPGHMKDGRFGDFLDNLKDWALSRDRYWGTPLNIWTCNDCGHQLAVGSRKELVEHAADPKLAEEVEFHRPFIDEVKLTCPSCDGEMERVPYVLDTWFDSGSMHTAQLHYPFENQDEFTQYFPADFICEGQDQTRGWFYTLHVTSTLLHGQSSFKNVLVTGYGLDSEGNAMSKSKGNVIDPWKMINKYGADAIRWYLYSSTAPWKTRRLEEEGPGEVLYKFLDTVKNTYNFFSLYADIDDFDPDSVSPADVEPSLIDRWINSRLAETVSSVTDALDGYDVPAATGAIKEFVDDLSNWYVRCSRERFWSSGPSADKTSAYYTLYRALVDLSKLFAPFTPFLAEEIYQNLKGSEESVHLANWPEVDESAVDTNLEERMKEVRTLTGLGRKARSKAGIKVRQPLRKIVVKPKRDLPDLSEELLKIIREELNVKEITFEEDLQKYYVPVVEPDFSKLGPKFESDAQLVGDLVKKKDNEAIANLLEGQGEFQVESEDESFKVTKSDVTISYEPGEDYAEVEDRKYDLLLDLSLDKELLEEGYVRELIRRIQQLRKEAGFEVTDRIELFFRADSKVNRAIEKHSEYLKSETLAQSLSLDELPDEVDITKQESLNGKEATIALNRIS
ncbi:isoleucine--tRNA ligase, partial [Candidatus Bipolaricaulota bacterium]|nr:isoleucine--tRNA ligase [Candidatus Bipolaricaulota bacterium]